MSKPKTASIFTNKALKSSDTIPSSSIAFGTPTHTPKSFVIAPAKATILPILLPPATLRPLAFRSFTKKHSLTLSSTALQQLATFIGRHCGSGWREEGLAEKVLEEVARSWKNGNGGVIVEGDSTGLKDILKTLEGNMSGGRIVTGAKGGLSRQNSLAMDSLLDSNLKNTRLGLRPKVMARDDSQASFGMSGLGVHDGEEAADEDEGLSDPRNWMKVIDAYHQPRMTYNVSKKHFEKETSKPSLMPSSSHKTALFRNRYNIIHQRLMRNVSFQESTVSVTKGSKQSSLDSQETHRITPISNLLGRHGSHHMLLGLLSILPTGTLSISDLTGTISLDLSHAICIPDDSAWFCPGMIVLVDGIYEEEDESRGRGLGSSNGIGGIIGGRFQGLFIGQPPSEKRNATLGVTNSNTDADHAIGGGFGWIDFLGVGSERAVGTKMRRLENRILRLAHTDDDTGTPPPTRGRIVILGEMNLDQPRVLQALRKILSIYNTDAEGSLSPPMTFVLVGNFTQHAVMASGGASGGSVEYKEYFDSLASVLAEYPALLRSSDFVFVPGDNDGWMGSFGAGAAVPLPRKAIPDMFTSRIRRSFATANAEPGTRGGKGNAIWASNPARLSVFGPCHETVLFRDDMSARLRRTAVRLKSPQEKSHEDRPPSAPGTDDIEMSGALNDIPPVEQVMDIDDMVTEVPQPKPAGPPTIGKPELSYDILTARKLVKTLLDQGFLAPFRQQIRPLHWDFASALHLYPLPSAMVLVDTTAPAFCITYEGCHVMNPGPVLVSGRRGLGRWLEYELGGSGRLRECPF